MHLSLVILSALGLTAVACGSDSKAVFGSGAVKLDCSPSGTWATFVEVGVEWESGTILAGAGKTMQWILSHRAPQASGQVDSARACGIGAQGVPLGSNYFHTIEIPGVLTSEWTGVTFEAALFDGGGLPEVLLPIGLVQANPSRLSPGDQFATPPLPFQFGVDGLGGDQPWPDRAGIESLMVDHDGDGHPGLTGFPFQGPVPGEAAGVVFNYPRLTLEATPPRAAELYMAIRTRAALKGTLSSCAPPRFEGKADPTTLQIDVRNVACGVVGTNAACTPDQVNFIDVNLPQFKPNGTSRVVSIKVPDDTTCADVRAMSF